MHAKHADNSQSNERTGCMISCAFTAINTLGAGFLEKVYENSLAYEVRAAGLSAVQQYGAKAHYKTFLVCPWLTNRAAPSACFACIAFLHLR